MSTRDHIIQQIMDQQIILLRKAPLDQMLESLQSLGFIELLRAFPEEFEPLFVASAAENLMVDPPSLLGMLRVTRTCAEDESTYKHLKRYINSLDVEGS